VPRPKKAPGTAVDRRNGQRADLTLAPGGPLARFDPPAGLSPAGVQAWEDFWSDRPAQLMTAASRVVLLRWIDAVDRYVRTTAEADLEPLVTGSTGQLVENPLYRIAEKARSTIEACERQLGVGGLNATALGIAAITERRSLAEMNATIGGGRGDQNAAPAAGADASQDPRLRVIDG
jgi:hypothetical protein